MMSDPAAAAARLAAARAELDAALAEAKEAAQAMRDAGWSQYAIADALGVSRLTVRTWT